MLIITFLLCGHHLIHKVNLTFSLNKNKIRVFFSSLIVHLNYSYKQHKLNKSEIIGMTYFSKLFFFDGEGGVPLIAAASSDTIRAILVIF